MSPRLQGELTAAIGVGLDRRWRRAGSTVVKAIAAPAARIGASQWIVARTHMDERKRVWVQGSAPAGSKALRAPQNRSSLGPPASAPVAPIDSCSRRDGRNGRSIVQVRLPGLRRPKSSIATMSSTVPARAASPRRTISSEDAPNSGTARIYRAQLPIPCPRPGWWNRHRSARSNLQEARTNPRGRRTMRKFGGAPETPHSRSAYERGLPSRCAAGCGRKTISRPAQFFRATSQGGACQRALLRRCPEIERPRGRRLP